MPARSKLRIAAYVAAVLVLSGGALVVGMSWLTTGNDPLLCAALGKQRIVQVYTQGPRLRCEGVSVRPLASAAWAPLLKGDDPAPLASALMEEKGTAVAIVPEETARGLLGRLGRFESIPGLNTTVLGPELVVFTARGQRALSLREQDALAYVARAVLRGAREPRIASFPSAVRRVERVEVMVSILSGGSPRLWRSARGTSIARALMTATRVARDRWREREQAMGGPLREQLGELDVEVSLLQEDGTLLSVEEGFVNRATSPDHGLGYDYRNGWHYVLPEAVATRGGGSPYKALTSLVRDQGLGAGVLAERGTRVYRFVPRTIGRSAAPLRPEPEAGLAP